jgi:hypothetical protein
MDGGYAHATFAAEIRRRQDGVESILTDLPPVSDPPTTTLYELAVLLRECGGPEGLAHDLDQFDATRLRGVISTGRDAALNPFDA